jgi:hypothetical protein
MPTETVRVERMNEAERTLVNMLSPRERKEALVRAAQIKARENLSITDAKLEPQEGAKQ